MSRKIFIDAFFNQFNDFLEQLIRVFPDDSEFPAYLAGLKLLQRTNPMLVITQVKEHVSPYEETIRAKNEDFFLKHSFDDHGTDDALDQVINKLKGLWAVLDDKNKQHVWEYVTVLLELAKRCTSV